MRAHERSHSPEGDESSKASTIRRATSARDEKDESSERRYRERSPLQADRTEEEQSRRKKAKTGGFNWKSKPTVDTQDDAGSSERLERGYNQKEATRPRSPERDDVTSKFGANYQARYSRPAKEDGVNKSNGAVNEHAGDASRLDKEEERKKKKKKEKKDRGPRPTTEPLIRVFVNDRLGTRVEVPCLGSDPIKLFKAQVAQRVGRKPHEIMLKRQGERPFKDHLTLEDYGISNGVQLDLEVDTGD